MADVFDGPFAGVAAITEVVSAAAQTEILGEIDKVIALLTVQTASSQTSMPSPDFDQIPPHTATKLVAELEALKTAIDAAPTA